MSSVTENLRRRLLAALTAVRAPGAAVDIVADGHVQDLAVDDDGGVRFQFVLRPEDPGTLVREVRAAAQAVDGIGKVRIDVKLPQVNAKAMATAGNAHAHAHGAASKGGPAGRGSIPAPTPPPDMLPNVRRIIAVSSGKGGVGKSTVATNLAAALAAAGNRVGLLDADIYGPDIPLMFGEQRKPKVSGEKGQEKIVPLEAHGVHLMSLGFLLDPDQPAIMRGPMVSGILRQFLEQVEWGRLDYMIVDMPPGTGDAQLSLVQSINLDGAVLVTTPQEVSTGDVRRAIRMFERVRTRVLGIVENMAGLECPHCAGHIDLFGHGGGEKLATEAQVPFLGSVPLDVAVRVAGDAGTPSVVGAPESAASRAFSEIAAKVAKSVETSVIRA